MNESPACKLCGSQTEHIGDKWGSWKKISFRLQRCRDCRYAFVADPWTDFAAIYSDPYYDGKGADPLVDYHFELDYPDQTIRLYEWRGILRLIQSLVPLGPQTHWLDFGCGNGGLVRYCSSRADCRIAGFEEGAVKHRAARLGIPLIEEKDLDRLAGTFDIVTAIEVFEHVENPLDVLRRIRALLKPGGLLFYTTGNAHPHRENLIRWSYVIPEIHISFYEPETLRRALEAAGFLPEYRGYLPGYTDILRFKILKNLRVRRRAAWEQALPWSVVARLVNAYARVTGLPIAWAGGDQYRNARLS
ncbi:MAG TPA: class I SAM-dependent methyltransferase [Bryobacteraceae bacterium]|jgi:2-polyprenyl-3-methyl-5-hydroxy-6-metoxy-1,4-benzoquinol methylase|nr:class I SAM-dependent methyltransferase [Bryobacteraceae bacterium]